MNIFSVPEAKHYCGHFTKTSLYSSASFKSHLCGLGSDTSFVEGTVEFNEFRDGLLRESERLLFLSAVHYKKSYDLLAGSSCAWAHTTMYYGSYYAALSLLAMFGAWVHFGHPGSVVAYVENGTPGFQKITFKQTKPYVNGLSTYQGPHRKFWDVFYSLMTNLIPSLPLHKRWNVAISPVLGTNRTWLIDKRNDLNYDSFQSINMMVGFQKNFRSRNFLATLPGDLKIQYDVMLNMIELSFFYAKHFGLRTDSLTNLKPSGSRKRKIMQTIIYGKSHRLVGKSKMASVF
ncbi:MAG TPA: hypothetical protein PLY88_01600 [Candidatus Omnitrophota bacterium]|nr:hypothetical protein [Candidatus Omnitrophota bacterium]